MFTFNNIFGVFLGVAETIARCFWCWGLGLVHFCITSFGTEGYAVFHWHTS